MASYFLLFDLPEDERPEDAFILYPNPVGDVLELMKPNGSCHYQIYAMDGSTMSSGIVESTIDVKMLPAGYYTLEIIQQDDKRVSQKFIKQ